MTTNLSEELLVTTLQALPGWESNGSSIWRDVNLSPEDTQELRRQVSVDAGALGKEPEVTDRGNGVTRFTLGSAGGVTEVDIALASHLSDLMHRLKPTEPGVDAVRDDAPEIVSRATDGSGQTAPSPIGSASAGSTGSPVMPLAGKQPHSPEAGVSTEQSRP
ncbi:MAG: putative pterin-4-alpha-carbinolamine dehydratase [Frankiales bacterium]|nr:putative pterin-4-alpha-carbinolamine dehydratase [Frankiales bacterium]